MNTRQHPWTVVIFACRESLSRLRQTLDAAKVSAASCAVIHVLVNGNQALASALAQELTQRQLSAAKDEGGPAIQVWSIPLGDKANAWNQYIHQIWAGEEIAFFVDGYVRLNPDAVDLLGHAVAANTQALAGTGVPTMGRSAKALRENMIVNTGYHGNFCCIKGHTIGQMRDKHIRLPVGLYRTDSLMGAFLCFALDPSKHAWEDYRIHVHPSASWKIDEAKWWRWRDVRAAVNRHFRQVRGKLENAAFTDHLAKRQCSPAKLPATARELVLEWAMCYPDDFKRITRKNILAKQALAAFQSASLMPSHAIEPALVWHHDTQITS
ncbi:hypothetical protein [Rhodoferax fermentans]|uniref:Glycosyltransferase 2-like domain-containing protein n=1 Tax=Rhodoferax fermentans TaxID=28066 RepID=A0A1T1AT66_RHOFE|nr:hypothetical protein [Rhodoferax fermentans]OOV07296.1 hypothetical protein RF819_11650 [Rhodoferax fermentans]